MKSRTIQGALSLVTAVIAVLALAGGARAANVLVNDAQSIINAVNNAAPGDVITIFPGTYDLSATGGRLDPRVDVTIRGGGGAPSSVELLGDHNALNRAHVLVENLTLHASEGAFGHDGGSLVFRHGRIICEGVPFAGTCVQGDFGPLTLIDVEIVGTHGVGVGLFYDGGRNRDGLGGLTLVNVRIHGFSSGLQSFANDPITIIDTHVFGNTVACQIQVRGPFVTSGSTDDDGTCPFSPQNLNTPTGAVTVSPLDLQRGGTPVTLTFGNVTQAGETTVYSLGTAGPPPPSGFQIGTQPIYYEIDTTALFIGSIRVCIEFDPSNFPLGMPTLVHFDSSGNPASVTPAPSSKPNQVCGDVASLSPFAVLAQSAVPFAALTAKVEIEPHELELEATFTLGAASDGIDPVNEPLTLQVGGFSTTIPAHSFRSGKEGRFKFEGVVDGIRLEVKIRALGGQLFRLQGEAHGANLTGTTNPVTVKLTIGDDHGDTTVTARISRLRDHRDRRHHQREPVHDGEDEVEGDDEDHRGGGGEPR